MTFNLENDPLVTRGMSNLYANMGFQLFILNLGAETDRPTDKSTA